MLIFSKNDSGARRSIQLAELYVQRPAGLAGDTAENQKSPDPRHTDQGLTVVRVFLAPSRARCYYRVNSNTRAMLKRLFRRMSVRMKQLKGW